MESSQPQLTETQFPMDSLEYDEGLAQAVPMSTANDHRGMMKANLWTPPNGIKVSWLGATKGLNLESSMSQGMDFRPSTYGGASEEDESK